MWLTHDTQDNDTHIYDTQHSDTQHKDTKHDSKHVLLSKCNYVIMVGIIMPLTWVSWRPLSIMTLSIMAPAWRHKTQLAIFKIFIFWLKWSLILCIWSIVIWVIDVWLSVVAPSSRHFHSMNLQTLSLALFLFCSQKRPHCWLKVSRVASSKLLQLVIFKKL